MLLKPLSLPQPERLVKIEERHAGWASTNFTNANFVDIARQTRTLERLGAYRPWLFSLSGEGEPEDVDGYRVCRDNFFNALGVSPMLGRTFSAAEDQPGVGGVVVLSHGLWKRRFGSDAGIVGKTCKINGGRSQIIGVMPAKLDPEDAGLWMPLALDNALRTNRRARVIGRLKSGVTLEQARSEMRTLSAVIDAENKSVDPDWTAYPSPFGERLVADVGAPDSCLVLRGGIRAADRLRQCGEPFAGASRGTRQGNRRSGSAGGGQGADCAAIADGERFARRGCSDRGSGAGRLWVADHSSS